jgi:probable rRNA maturation factor
MISIDPQALALVPGAETLSRPAISRFLNRARAAVGLEGEVEVLLTSDAELKRLNRAFRNKNKATDILSFPTPPEIADHHAGDLAISLETAARQAAQFGHTLSDELRILILHGLLHLSGLDHETDSGEMAARECELRATLKLPVSLIARVTTKSAPKRPSKVAAKKSPRKTVATPAMKRGKP